MTKKPRKTFLVSIVTAVYILATMTACNNGVNSNNPSSDTVTTTVTDLQTPAPETTTEAATTIVTEIATTTEKKMETSATTPAPETTTITTTVKPETQTPAPEWEESKVSGTKYVNTACFSRKKAIIGVEVVKLYNVNDKVTVVAKTNTGYYKLDDGTFIHSDYLSDSKVVITTTTVQTALPQTEIQVTTPATTVTTGPAPESPEENGLIPLSNILKITPTFYDDLIPYEGMIPSPDNTVLIIDTKDNRKEFAFSDWTATPVVRKRNLLVTSFTYNGYTQEFIYPNSSVDLPTSLSPKEVYQKLLALKSTYPEGMRYTDNEVYTTSYDNRLAIGYGCHGFALQISDDIFETARYTRTSNFTMDDIKPGVIVRIQNDTHTIVVLEKKENTVVIVEGNYYGTVHWGRELSYSEILGGDYIITRY